MVCGQRARYALLLAIFAMSCARTSPQIPRPTLVGIQVDPSDPTVALGDMIQLVVQGVMSDGTTDVPEGMTCASANEALVSVRYDKGRVWATGLRTGTTELTCTAPGLASPHVVSITVTSARTKALAITPRAATVGRTGVATFQATATLTDGTTSNVTSFADWSVSDTSIATVGTGTAKGKVTGIKAGAVKVTAHYQGLTAMADLTVVPALLVRVDVTPSTLVVPIKASMPLKAVAVFDDFTVSDITDQAEWRSSEPRFATVSSNAAPRGVVTGIAAGNATVTATYSGKSGTAAVTATDAHLVRIEVTPPVMVLAKGTTGTFQATAIYSGTVPPQDVSQIVSWATSPSGIVSLSPSSPGEVKAAAVGTATVSASLLGLTGMASVRVTAPTLLSIDLTPKVVAVPKGVVQPFTAVGNFTDGSTQDITGQALWSSSDETVATVSNASGSNGSALALKEGATVIRATLGGVVGNAVLTVSPATVKSLDIDTDPSTEVIDSGPLAVAKGVSAPLRAIATYSDETLLDVTDQADWSSDANATVSVTTLNTGRGVVTGIKPGIASVTAAFAGKTSQVQVVVTAPKLVALTLSPADFSLGKGATQQMVATGTYSDKTTYDETKRVVWSVEDALVVRVSNASGSQGLVTALGMGTTRIKATLLDQTATAKVTVTPSTLKKLVIDAPSPVVLDYKETRQLRAIALYSDSTSVYVTDSADWVSAGSSIASVTSAGPSRGLVTGNNHGSTTITASFQGLSATVDVTVNTAPVTKIEIRPAALSLAAGKSGDLTCWALRADGVQLEVTNQASWSAFPGNATVDTNGHVTAISPGTATVTARYETLSATATVQVTAPLVDMVTITPTTAKIPIGGSQSFTVTAALSDGTHQNVTSQALFTTNDTQGRVGLSGNTASGLKAGGPVAITAAYGGKQASAQLTVLGVASLSLSPGSSILPVGLTQTFTATALLTDGSTLDVTGQAIYFSSDPATVTLNANTAVAMKEGGPVTLTASYSGASATAQVIVTPPIIQSITLLPSGLVLQKGESGQLKAIANFSDRSTLDVTSLALWDSSNYVVCSVSSGLVKGVGAGKASVSATYRGVTGTASIVVETPVLTRIAIVPPNAVLRLNLIYPYRAYGLYSNGTVVEVPRDESYWRSDNPSITQPINYNGYFGVWAKGAGLTNLHVNFDSSMGNTRVQALNSSVTGVEVTPAKIVLPAGTAAKLSGVFAFKTSHVDGWAVEIQNPNWQSNNSTFVTVDANGVATGLRAGTTTIDMSTYDANGTYRSARTSVTVTRAALQSIALDVPPTMVVGLATKVHAMGTFSDGSVMDLGPSPVIWSVSNSSLATIVPDVDGAKVTANAAGTVTVKASILGVEASVPVSLTATTLRSLALNVAQTALPQGSTSRLMVVGTFEDGTTLDLTDSATFTSSAPDVAQVVGSPASNMPWPVVLAHVPDQSPQSATLTATFLDKTATSTVQVTGANLASLALAVGTDPPSSSLTLRGGGPFQLRVMGTFTDGNTADVTSLCTFEPANPGTGVVATLSNAASGKVTLLGKGSEQITATYAPSYIGQPMVSGSATLTVQ